MSGGRGERRDADATLLLRWTRREEADFYRVVSTFGVVFDPSHSRFDWTKFRAMARLHKKTDESLQKYLCAFTAMCRRVCRLPPKEGGGWRPIWPVAGWENTQANS